jgi:hypothetical protein
MENGQIPLALTRRDCCFPDTPDIFAGPAMGYLLDNSQGEQGHQHVLDVVFFFYSLSLWYSLWLEQRRHNKLQLIDTFKTKLNSNPKLKSTTLLSGGL